MAWRTLYRHAYRTASVLLLCAWLWSGTAVTRCAEETTPPPAAAAEAEPVPVPPLKVETPDPVQPPKIETPMMEMPREFTPNTVRRPFMLWELFQRGGWSMWLILVCIIVGFAFFFERAFDLRRRRHTPREFEKDLVHVVDTRGVDLGLALCLDKPSSIARVLYGAMLRYGSPRPELEIAVKEEVRRVQYDLRRNSRYVLLMAFLAPTIGLLASIAGLISAFDAEQASGEAIGTALLPFCFGLGTLAIFILLYAYTRFKADDLSREIEEKSIDALISLDRKAKRSIRQIEDVEEALETKTMPAAKDPFAPIKTPEQPAKLDAALKKPEPEKIPPALPVESAADFLIPWNLDAELHNDDVETSIKTGVATPAHAIKLGVAGNPHGSAARLAAAAANAGKGSGLMRVTTGKHNSIGPVPPIEERKPEPQVEEPKQV